MSRKQQIQNALLEINNNLQGHHAKVIAVTKTKPAADIELAIECGQKDFGENKVQELLEKANSINHPGIRWHFIGNLQSNKINQLLKVPNLYAIHSIDSLKLLVKILSKKPSAPLGLFLQVNTSGEDEKSGFTNESDLFEAVSLLKNNDDFYLQGLMTIGKIRTQNFDADAKECFKKLVNLKDKILNQQPDQKVELSMGMSQDYMLAAQAGSNWVRVGSLLFGNRPSTMRV